MNVGTVRISPSSSEAGLTVALIPEGSRSQALQTFQSYFVEEVYLDWLTSISTVPYLEAELAEIPAAFEKLYVCRTQPGLILCV